MNQETTNNMLRQIVSELVNKGWPKSYIGKILLGANGQAHLSQWTKKDENDHYKNFGIKPLSKIGELLGYELHLCFLPKTICDENNNVIQERDENTEQFINSLNQKFKNELQKNMEIYLQESLQTKESKETNIDDIINNMINNLE